MVKAGEATAIYITLFRTNQTGVGEIKINITWFDAVFYDWGANMNRIYSDGNLNILPAIIKDNGVYKIWYSYLGQSATSHIRYI